VRRQIWSKIEQARLSDSVTENLIEHYHNENVLWDVNNANFMNLELKDAAWERTSAALNLPTGNVAVKSINSMCFAACLRVLWTVFCVTHEHRDYSDKISDKINIHCHFIARQSCDTRSKVVVKSQCRSRVVVVS